MQPNVTIIQPISIVGETTKTHVAAYCRLSSDSDDQINSYMAQVTYYSHLFDDSETEILVDCYADEGVTGTCADKRDEFQRLLQDCRKGKIDRIITKSISRFARNIVDCLNTIRELKVLGVMFEKENIDTAKLSDEMMIIIMGGLAQEESISISKNVKWSYRKQMQDGTILLRSAPFGYRLIDGRLAIEESEAEIVRGIFELYLAGKGYQTIAHELNRRGVSKPKSKTKWLAESVRYIILNEKYIGDSLWQKSFNLENPFRRVRNHSELEQCYLAHTHDAIIARERKSAMAWGRPLRIRAI